MADDQTKQTLLLVGAGHAHLHLILHAKKLTEAGLRVIVIAPRQFWYSGLATGVLSGAYSPDEDVIDITRLTADVGVEHFATRVVSVDRTRRVVVTSDNHELPYDLLSFNIGSRVDRGTIDIGDDANLVDVKPIAQLVALRHALETDSTLSRTITIIGAGPTGCEVAACLSAIDQDSTPPPTITLLAHGDRLLHNDAPRGAVRSITRVLRKRGVQIRFNCEVVAIDKNTITLTDGELLHSDTIIAATGLVPPILFTQLGWTVGPDGGLTVRRTLQSRDDDRIFGAGDCIDFDGQRLPRLGVFGVRQAPVLLDNIIARAADNPLRDYTPQRRWLSILNLGRGTALALYGRLYFKSRLSMRLKHHLDRRFLNRFR